MPIDTTTDTSQIRLSGTVTSADMLALSTGVTIVDNVFVKLERDLWIATNTVLDTQGLGIIVNNQAILFEDETNPSQFQGVNFIYNVNSHWKARYLNLTDCSCLGAEGSGIFSILSANNFTVMSKVRDGTGTELFFEGGGLFSNVSFYSSGRLGLQASSAGQGFWLRKLAHNGEDPLKIGYNKAPSSIWEDFTAPNVASGTEGMEYLNTFRASDGDHKIMLLGKSIDTFYRGETSINVHNVGADDNTRYQTGGIKYWQINNHDGNANLYVFDSRGNSPARCIPTTDRWDLLETTTSVVIPTSGEITFIVTSGEKTGSTETTSVLTAVNNNVVVVAEYGKQLFVRDYNNVTADVIATEGSADGFTPILLLDDSDVTLTRAQANALTTISNRAQAHAAYSLWQEGAGNDVPRDQAFSSFEEDSWRLTGRNLVLDATATNLFTVTSDTVTIRSSTFTGNITLDNDRTLTFANGATIAGTYVDSTRNAAVTIIGVDLNAEANTLEVSQNSGVTWSPLETNVFAYNAGPGTVTFRYTKGNGEEGDPIVTTDDYSLAAPGTTNQFSSFASETAQLLNAQTNTITNTLNNLVSTVTNNQSTINRGVQDASLSIPHTTDL